MYQKLFKQVRRTRTDLESWNLIDLGIRCRKVQKSIVLVFWQCFSEKVYMLIILRLSLGLVTCNSTWLETVTKQTFSWPPVNKLDLNVWFSPTLFNKHFQKWRVYSCWVLHKIIEPLTVICAIYAMLWSIIWVKHLK